MNPAPLHPLTDSPAQQTRDIVRQVLVVAALISTLIITYLVSGAELPGVHTTKYVSDKHLTYVTPASYAFSIWSLIYLGLLLYVLYQALPSQRTNPRLRRIGMSFLMICIFNGAWVIVFGEEYLAASCILLWMYLLSVVAIYRTLALTTQETQLGGQGPTALERWLVNIPFSILLGWLTLAAIVDTALTLQAYGYQGAPLGASGWAVLLCVAVLAIGLFFTLRLRDIAVGLTLAWGLAGIALYHPQNMPVYSTALGCAAVLGIASLYILIRGGSASKFGSQPRPLTNMH